MILQTIRLQLKLLSLFSDFATGWERLSEVSYGWEAFVIPFHHTRSAR